MEKNGKKNNFFTTLTPEQMELKKGFIRNYANKINNAADGSQMDANANITNKNIHTMEYEIHKDINIQINRALISDKIRELYGDDLAKEYIRQIESHEIYVHDETSLKPYCVSITMYPFLLDGLKTLGGGSVAPKHLSSFCGGFINLMLAVSSQFAGAVATAEFLMYFDYFARKEWGDLYYEKPDCIVTTDHCERQKTIRSQIHQYFQQVVYSVNQPAAARGLQSAFVNFSLFDKAFYYGMFDSFYFPDGSKPQWESLQWLQKEFLHWFNQERLKCILTFPVVSCTLLYKDGEFQDKDFYEFICQEYAEGNSFFLYISDTVDSLSSCCRLKNKIQTKEFNFTNGNMGVNHFRPLCA